MKLDELENISTCEEYVLSVILDEEEAPALMEIVTKVNHKYHKAWKPQTVSTFLSRLRNKGYLTMEKRGRYCYYTPTFTKQEYLIWRMKRDCILYYDGDFNEMRKVLDAVAKIARK